jgi:hypothetical protein
MKLLRVNARDIRVLKAGVSRKPLTRRESFSLSGTKRGPGLHAQHDPNPLAKYQNWMAHDDCGGMTARVTGSF